MPLFTSVYEDTSPFLVYTDAWAPASPSSLLNEYSEASFHSTNQLGAYLTFQFYGTNVSILGAKSGNHGLYQVTIDGTAYPEENGDADPIVFREVLFSRGLEQGLHTVKLENTENLFLDVDQVSWTTNVGTEDEELIINTHQNLHPSWTYQPEDAWSTSFPDAGSFSGGGGQGTSMPAAVAELTFSVRITHPLPILPKLTPQPPRVHKTSFPPSRNPSFSSTTLGDCIALFGGVGPNAASAYSVQINNSSTQQFSALQPYPRSKELLYWAGGLGSGTHTLRVRKDSSISDQILMIDFANVYTAPSLGGSWQLSETSPNQPGSTTTGASKGLIAGIALISSLAGLALIALLAFLFIRRRRRQQHKTVDSPHVPSVPQSRPHDATIHPFIAGGSSGSPAPTHHVMVSPGSPGFEGQNIPATAKAPSWSTGAANQS
ncbi:hypothetical protein BKA70DRAFT_1427078 [Coprinopsis sp. MPI-PUGE-AT-0042]|nr:hypothetical protein BKA70DRAFT_1427078 [Coprinopsis sp. MPI-PUGE-AT-0042]